MGEANASIPLELIERRIYLIRGQKVMMDQDLAEIYGVSTKRLNERVRRNKRRFPEDFLFRLTAIEAKKLASLRSQFATLKKSRGSHRKYPPLVFTEHGAVMLASVLNSATAVTANIHVVRAFVRLRQMAADHKHLADRFPADFMFHLSWEEVRRIRLPGSDVKAGENLRSQFVILKRGRNVKYRPYAFTEQGVAMLSSVLRVPEDFMFQSASKEFKSLISQSAISKKGNGIAGSAR